MVTAMHREHLAVQRCSQYLLLQVPACVPGSWLMELVFLEDRYQGLARTLTTVRRVWEMTYISTDITIKRHTCQSVAAPLPAVWA